MLVDIRDGRTMWRKMFMVGVFADFALAGVDGDIFEIGIGESSVWLGKVAQKYNRKIFHCDHAFVAPLWNFWDDIGIIEDNPDCPKYIPAAQCFIFKGTSDNFFKKVVLPPIACAFIDGDHSYEQVKKDFDNILPYIVDNGYILLHDTYPLVEEYLDMGRCGTAYKLRQEIEKDDRFDCITLVKGCGDVGLTIVRKKPEDLPYYQK